MKKQIDHISNRLNECMLTKKVKDKLQNQSMEQWIKCQLILENIGEKRKNLIMSGND